MKLFEQRPPYHEKIWTERRAIPGVLAVDSMRFRRDASLEWNATKWAKSMIAVSIDLASYSSRPEVTRLFESISWTGNVRN
jgi:hypothetical protein